MFLSICCAASLLGSGALFQAQGQIIPLVDGNSSALVDTGSQAGMFNWTVEGVNQLFQQWFWFRIGPAGPEAAINTISAPAILTPGPNMLTTTYANAALNIRVDYTLTGGAPGSGNAHINESITINNTSGAALDFHFFQYSDYDLNGAPGGDTAQLKKNALGLFNEADQSKGPVVFTENDVTPGANHGEISFYPLTLNSLNDGAPTTLSDTVGPLGPGDVTWALEWDQLIPNGQSMLISKLKDVTVPEPSALTLVCLGLAGFLCQRRRR